ncbi:unnamed protein product [Parnassius apollo]|uniref:(apollo) hypothetical protein n=1 Tax=Parnassius apollo TaxID=110799 RepID=A0A8S3VYY5_PARAO|nr:unnamed protein product [Parnassius apollo]
MTALRLVQRMKRDSIHSGRRPSGICGAALLIAARLHDFSRTPADVVRIVKVHESTLRKRLMEFGDTPSSALTLDEFMTVDLEEEQDPPAFRAARKRDKERLQKLLEEEDGERELTELQKEIDLQLEKDNTRRRKLASSAAVTTVSIDESSIEDVDASRFAAEDTLHLLGEIARETGGKNNANSKQEKFYLEKGLGPDLAVIGLGQPEDKSDKFVKPEPKAQFSKDLHSADELLLNEKDEEYISSLIMTEEEARYKTKLWNNINAGYLKEQKIKEEMRAREREEGKDKKKKIRGAYKKKVALNAATAGEAIEKMLAEKKISSKINYDILKSLDQPGTPVATSVPTTPARSSQPVIDSKPVTPLETVPASPVPRKRKKKATPTLASPVPAASARPTTPAPPTPTTTQVQPENLDDYDDDDIEAEPTDAGGEISLAAMLQNGDEDDYYGYEEY